MTEYIIYDTDDVNLKKGSLTEVRNSIDNSLSGEEAIVSVCVRIWRDSRLEKVKSCIESVLKYERDVKFKLVLMNNGGSQAVTDYFESIDYNDKTIIRITKNISAPHGGGIFQRFVKTKYMVELLNDNIVTPHWLSNMVKCLESDPKIGVACPLCTNCIPGQEPPFKGKSVDELLSLSETFNISDPSKWEELMLCVPQGAVFRRAVFDAVGIYDKGYMHQGADDDLSLRIRRAGYKQILCKDTFIIHDHDYNSEPADMSIARQGWDGYKEKFHGIDSYIDIYNSVRPCLGYAIYDKKEEFKILGIECRAGNPIIEIKNKAYAAGNRNIHCDAYTTEAKYYEDLNSICDNVYCDSNESRINSILKMSYDFIVIDKDINLFNRPFDVLDFVLTHARNGQIILKVKNMADIGILMRCLGGTRLDVLNGHHYIEYDNVISFIKQYKVNDIKIIRELNQSSKLVVDKLLSDSNIRNLVVGNVEEIKQNLETNRIWLLVKV